MAKPTDMQLKTLNFLAGQENGTLVEDVPRRTAWYARDVLKRMVGRGWVSIKNPDAPKHVQVFTITNDGRTIINQNTI